MSEEYKPRLCHIVRGASGYGFHLHGEKGKYGQSIRKVEEDSAAEQAGLKTGDRIIAVNGKNVESESHQQVVARIKEKSGETDLLVVDEASDRYFRENNIAITEDLLVNGVRVEEPMTSPEPTPEPTPELTPEPTQEPTPDTTEPEPSNESRPRLCHLVRGEDGYGFNLHSEKGKVGRFVRSVDDNGASAIAGLKAGDRIIEVNGKNMEYDKHTELVAAIKASGQEVDLLVVDEETDAFFKSCQVTPTSDHISGPLPTPVSSPPTYALATSENKTPSAPANTPAGDDAPQANGNSLLDLDLTALKERSKAKKKQAPSSNWNNRQAIFNNL